MSFRTHHHGASEANCTPIPVREARKNRTYREIRVMQRYSGFLVPRAAMIRFIREIAQSINPNLRFRSDALSAIQEAAEAFIIKLFKESNLLALHRKRVTVELCGMQLVCHFMDRHNFLR